MKIILQSILPLFFLANANLCNAQECRDMTKDEQQAYQKLIAVLNNALVDKLENSDWSLNGSTSPQHVLVALKPMPARPMMFCESGFQASFQLDQNSEYAQKINDSANYYMNLSSSVDDANLQLKYIKKYTSFITRESFNITVHENVPDYYLQEPGSGELIDHYNKLSVNGAALAFQIWYAPAEKGDEPAQQTVLCFGKWKDNMVKSSSDRWYFPFNFQHQVQTPFIENMIIVIKANAEKANEIIKQIDWTKMNDAMTE